MLSTLFTRDKKDWKRILMYFFPFKKGGKVLIWNSNASENSCSLITALLFWLWFFFLGGCGGVSHANTRWIFFCCPKQQ